MKKKEQFIFSRIISVLLLVLVISMMISSCASNLESSGESENVYKVQGEGLKTEENDSNKHTAIRITGDLHDSLISEHGAKTEKGYYEVILWPEDMMPDDHGYIWYGNIAYIDYETCQRIYLCNVPGCAHNTAECTSFVEFSGAVTLLTDYSEKHLFLMSKGVGTVEDDAGEEALASIIEMNLDGSNRRTICVLSPTECIADNSIQVASDEYMYITVCKAQVIDEELKNTVSLERVWFSDGRREKVYDLTNNQKEIEILYSVWQDRDLIICRSEFKMVPGQSVTSVSIDTYINRISQDGDILERYGPYSYANAISGGYLLEAEENGETADLTLTSIEDGNNVTVYGIPADASRIGVGRCFKMYGRCVNWFFVDKEERDRQYLVDFSDGSVTEYTLRCTSDNEEIVRIVAESKNEYLVITDKKDLTITLTDCAGMPHTYIYPGRPVYGMILKDDYWNCIPNYRTIDDKIM